MSFEKLPSIPDVLRFLIAFNTSIKKFDKTTKYIPLYETYQEAEMVFDKVEWSTVQKELKQKCDVDYRYTEAINITITIIPV